MTSIVFTGFLFHRGVPRGRRFRAISFPADIARLRTQRLKAIRHLRRNVGQANFVSVEGTEL